MTMSIEKDLDILLNEARKNLLTDVHKDDITIRGENKWDGDKGIKYKGTLEKYLVDAGLIKAYIPSKQ